jgi:nitroimidazol reductase NimA-like FMN-containing flavoprotein (pyridoxamine 5'-phosphate oxidase superfamily)
MLGELDAQQIEDLLKSQVVGRLGCHHEGRTYVVPITFAYDGEAVYGHSGDGLKLRMMRANPLVCFEVDQMDDLANWRSMIAWGVFEELHGSEAEAGMSILIRRLSPLMVSETSQPSHGMSSAGHGPRHAVIYRIRLDERTGRFERR